MSPERDFWFLSEHLRFGECHPDIILRRREEFPPDRCVNQGDIMRSNRRELLTLTVLKLAASSNPLTAAESRLR